MGNRELTPSARSFRLYRALGYLVDDVEKKETKARGRKFQTTDLWGIADLLAIAPHVLGLGPLSGPSVALIQATSRSNHSSRLSRVLEAWRTPFLASWGIRIECHAWGELPEEGDFGALDLDWRLVRIARARDFDSILARGDRKLCIGPPLEKWNNLDTPSAEEYPFGEPVEARELSPEIFRKTLEVLAAADRE